MSRLLLPAQLAGEIFADLGAAMPNEGCGLLIGRRTDADLEITQIAPSPNIAPAPENRFEIDPGLRLRTQRAARADGLSVIGHYHSHPGGEAAPSAQDRALARLEPELIWLIMGLSWGGPRGLAAWRLPPTQPPERLPIAIVEGSA